MGADVKTVNLVPSWVDLMPSLIAVLQDGTEEGKRLVTEELMMLARNVDNVNDDLAFLNDTTLSKEMRNDD